MPAIFEMRRLIPYFTVLIFIATVGCSGSGGSIGNRVRNIFGSNQQSSQIAPDEEAYELGRNIIDKINVRDYAGALDVLEILKSNPEHVWTWTSYIEAFIYHRLGRYEEALDILNNLNPGPYETSFLELRGYDYYVMNRLDEAKRDFESIDLTNPGANSYALGTLWEIALQQGDYDRAREIETIMDSRRNPDIPDILWAVERAILERDFSEAENALQRLPALPAIIADPDSPNYDSSVLTSRADLLTEMGEIDRAIGILEQLPDEMPNFTTSWPALGWLLYELGRYDEANTVIIKGLIKSGGTDILTELGIEIPAELSDVEPIPGPLRHAETSSLLVELGYIYLVDGDLDTALNCAEKALVVSPSEESACSLKSSVFEIRGDIENAIESAVAGMRIAPYDRDLALKFVALAKDAPMAVGPNDPDPAAVLSDLLIRARGLHELYPLDPEAAYFLAMTLRVADEDGSDDIFRQAWETWPYGAEYMLEYAMSLAKSGDIDGAKALIMERNIHPNFLWLFDILRYASDSDSADLQEFAQWIRSYMDPDGRFDAYFSGNAD